MSDLTCVGWPAHNCKPNGATGYSAPLETIWTCKCGKTWRKGNYDGWRLVEEAS